MNNQNLRSLNLAVAAALLSISSLSAQAATFSAVPFTETMVDKMVAGAAVTTNGADTNQIQLAAASGTTAALNLVKATAWASGSDSSSSNFVKATLTDQGVGLGARAPGETTSAPQHAIDNNGAREFVLFQFDQAVTLNALSLSYVDTDSDLSIAAFIGNSSTDVEALLAGGTVNSNTLAGTDWSRLNIANAGTGSENFSYFETAGAGGTAIASKYWLVGAYNGAFGTGTGLDKANDYVKLSGLGGKYTTPCSPPGSSQCTPTTVPEPSSITLAALGLLGGIRRWTSRKQA